MALRPRAHPEDNLPQSGFLAAGLDFHDAVWSASYNPLRINLAVDDIEETDGVTLNVTVIAQHCYPRASAHVWIIRVHRKAKYEVKFVQL
jgi:hypothetical protein